MRRRATGGLALLLAFLCGCGQPADDYKPGDLFIVDTTLVDVTSGELRPGSTIVVRGDAIARITSTASMAIPDDATVLAQGGFVIPGLWDMHTHSLGNVDAAIGRVLPLYVANGITGIRDMGSVVEGIAAVRRRLDEPPGIAAPEIVASGPLLDGVELPWYGDLPLVLESADEVDEALARLEARGIDFFKVYGQLSPDVYDAIARYANEADIAFAGHAPRAVGIARAAAAGQRSIEHVSLFTFGDCVRDPDAWFERALAAKFSDGGYDDYYAVVGAFFDAIDEQRCEAALDAVASAGAYFTPTLGMELNDRARVDEASLAYMAPGGRDWCETTLATIAAADPDLRERAYGELLALTYALHERGIPLLAGSDNPNNCLVPGFSLHTELERLVEAGLTPLDALRAATVNAADALGRRDDTGVVAEGYRASLVVLEADPLADIRNTRRITGVLVAGRWYDRDALRTMLEAVRPPAE